MSKAVRPAGQTYDAMYLPIAEDGVRKWGPAEKTGAPCDDGQAWTLRRDLEQRFAGGVARQAAVADEMVFDGHRMAGQREVHLLLDYGVEGRWVNEDDEPSLNRSSCSTPIKWPATTRSSRPSGSAKLAFGFVPCDVLRGAGITTKQRYEIVMAYGARPLMRGAQEDQRFAVGALRHASVMHQEGFEHRRVSGAREIHLALDDWQERRWVDENDLTEDGL